MEKEKEEINEKFDKLRTKYITRLDHEETNN
jgi:hypothetical protein